MRACRSFSARIRRGLSGTLRRRFGNSIACGATILHALRSHRPAAVPACAELHHRRRPAFNMTLASASERRGMENTLGVPAVAARARRRTPPGRTLAHHARWCWRRWTACAATWISTARGLKGLVRVHNTTALSEHLPPVLGEFLQRHPRVSVDLEERPPRDRRRLARGTCDIGVLADSADPGRPAGGGVPPRSAMPDRALGACAGRARRRRAGRCGGRGFRRAGRRQRQEHIAQHARRDGKSLSHRVRLRGFDAVCRMVGQGVGVAVVARRRRPHDVRPASGVWI